MPNTPEETSTEIKKIDEKIEKYKAKLTYLSNGIEESKHLLDEDTLEFMNDLKIVITEVISDFIELKNKS